MRRLALRIRRRIAAVRFVVGWLLLIGAVSSLVWSCQRDADGQQEEVRQTEAMRQCLELAHQCFEGMNRLSDDEHSWRSMANSCLWKWQTLQCHNLPRHLEVSE